MYNYLYDNDICVLKNCAKQQKKAIEKHTNLANETSRILNDLENNKISKKDADKKLRTLNKQMLVNTEQIELLDCQFNHCYNKIAKKVLRTMKDVLQMYEQNDYGSPLYHNQKKYYDEFRRTKITVKRFIQYMKDSKKALQKS